MDFVERIMKFHRSVEDTPQSPSQSRTLGLLDSFDYQGSFCCNLSMLSSDRNPSNQNTPSEQSPLRLVNPLTDPSSQELFTNLISATYAELDQGTTKISAAFTFFEKVCHLLHAASFAQWERQERHYEMPDSEYAAYVFNDWTIQIAQLADRFMRVASILTDDEINSPTIPERARPLLRSSRSTSHEIVPASTEHALQALLATHLNRSTENLTSVLKKPLVTDTNGKLYPVEAAAAALPEIEATRWLGVVDLIRTAIKDDIAPVKAEHLGRFAAHMNDECSVRRLAPQHLFAKFAGLPPSTFEALQGGLNNALSSSLKSLVATRSIYFGRPLRGWSDLRVPAGTPTTNRPFEVEYTALLRSHLPGFAENFRRMTDFGLFIDGQNANCKHGYQFDSLEPIAGIVAPAEGTPLHQHMRAHETAHGVALIACRKKFGPAYADPSPAGAEASAWMIEHLYGVGLMSAASDIDSKHSNAHFNINRFLECVLHRHISTLFLEKALSVGPHSRFDTEHLCSIYEEILGSFGNTGLDATSDASELWWAMNSDLYPTPYTYGYQTGIALAGLAITSLNTQGSAKVEQFLTDLHLLPMEQCVRELGFDPDSSETWEHGLRTYIEPFLRELA